jgi:small subunit ribosomal protein S20
MANTMSAKKQIRASEKKRIHNLFWKKRIRESLKDLQKSLLSKGADAGILNKKLVSLQTALDKASKEKVIHKNKADRLKSTYARKISALAKKPAKKTTTTKRTRKSAKSE